MLFLFSYSKVESRVRCHTYIKLIFLYSYHKSRTKGLMILKCSLTHGMTEMVRLTMQLCGMDRVGAIFIISLAHSIGNMLKLENVKYLEN